jgi:hypothetical protein
MSGYPSNEQSYAGDQTISAKFNLPPTQVVHTSASSVLLTLTENDYRI